MCRWSVDSHSLVRSYFRVLFLCFCSPADIRSPCSDPTPADASLPRVRYLDVPWSNADRSNAAGMSISDLMDLGSKRKEVKKEGRFLRDAYRIYLKYCKSTSAIHGKYVSMVTRGNKTGPQSVRFLKKLNGCYIGVRKICYCGDLK